MESPRRRDLAWLWYTLVRLGVFAVTLGVLLVLLPIEPWITAILAAVIAFCLSYIFLGRQRAAVAEQLAAARARAAEPDADDAAEDAAVYDSESEGAREPDSVDEGEGAREGEHEDQLASRARREGDEHSGKRE